MIGHELRVVGDPDRPSIARCEPVRRAASLEDVLRWAHAIGATLLDVVVQDEFTHDVIVQVGDRAYLCFDTT